MMEILNGLKNYINIAVDSFFYYNIYSALFLYSIIYTMF